MQIRLLTTLVLMSILGLNGCHKPDDALPETTVSARDFLSDEHFDKLIVELNYCHGFRPTSTTIAQLQTFLEARLHKPSGITITQEAIDIEINKTYTLEEIHEIEKSHRKLYPEGKTLTAYILFAGGEYAENNESQILGGRYTSTSLVIFEQTIQNITGAALGLPPLAIVESTVTLHEFAHLLGLVNNGTPMLDPHHDVSHGAHCTNENCLMYFSTETSSIFGGTVGGVIPSLDENCVRDLRANGGK